MPLRGVVIEADGEVIGESDAAGWSHDGLAVAVLTSAASRTGPHLALPLEAMGLRRDQPEVLAMAAAGLGLHLRDLALVAAPHSPLVDVAARVGVRVIEITGASAPLAPVAPAIRALEEAEAAVAGRVGVGPHPDPWPEDPRLDPHLLREGDRRNVVDRYRYWRESAIVADLELRRLPVHVAVENWQHDLNIGTVVRNANAYNVAGVHVVGKRRWNRRGAMATDRYLSVTHHRSVAEFSRWARERDLPVLGIDNVAGATAIEGAQLPAPAVLVFGQEGPGLSDEMVAACSRCYAITQHGSTRSLNAGVASGIALYAWAQAQPGDPGVAWPRDGPIP